MRLLTAVTALTLGSGAMAQDAAFIGEPDEMMGATMVQIRETDVPGAVAEVLFQNATVNHGRDEGRYELVFEDIRVIALFEFNVPGPGGPDAITLILPEGYVAVPDRVVVIEGFSAVMVIYQPMS